MNSATLELLETNLFIHHKYFEDVYSEILRFIQYGRRDDVLVVLGPTGVGKTTLIRFLEKTLTERISSGWRSDHFPPIVVEAPAQDNNQFPWRAFMENILLSLGEDNLGKKVDLDEAEECRRKGRKLAGKNRLTIGQLQELIRRRIESLRPVAMLIDEGQNIVEGITDKPKKANVNRLKNWANTMKTKIIIFGTHESEAILNLNEQLARRIKPIYFPRYKKTEEEIVRFAEFYVGLKDALQINVDPKLENDFEYLYNHSLGCAGILSGWVHDAIAYCINSNKKVINKTVMNKCRMSSDRLKTAELAIRKFEEVYFTSQKEFVPELVEVDENFDLFNHSAIELKGEKKTERRKPGKRKPERYPVGES